MYEDITEQLWPMSAWDVCLEFLLPCCSVFLFDTTTR
jgi:hypothetical protein